MTHPADAKVPIQEPAGRARHGWLRPTIVCLALLLSSFPYLFGVTQRVAGSQYTGIRPLNASDYNINLSWLQQFREGNFLLKNLYTSEPHRGFLVRPVYWLLAQPFRLLPTSNSTALHALTLLCGLVLLLTLFPLIRNFTDDSRITLVAFSLLTFTSGAGIVLKSVFPNSLDLSVPESILFLTLGEPPHLLYSLLFFWGGMVGLYKSRKDSTYLLLYLLCLVLLWWEHPFDAVTLVALGVVQLWLLRGRMRLLLPLAIAAVSLPPYLYYRALEKLPVYEGWSAQNVMLSPSIGAILSAFLPLIVLALPAVFDLWRSPGRRPMVVFLGVWICVQLVLAFLPFSFQRRLTAGAQFPLAVLAAFTLNRIRNWIPIAIIVLILSATNLYMMQEQIKGIAGKEMPFYLPDSYAETFRWLAEQKDSGAVISGFITGNFVPAYTGHAVYMGHSALTPQIARRRQETAAFFRNPQEEFLKQSQIEFVFWGREERRISSKTFGDRFSSLYTNDGISILSARHVTGPEIASLP